MEGSLVWGVSLEGHSMDPARVLAFAQALEACPGRVLLAGCQPEMPSGAEDDSDGGMRIGLSEPVRAAVDEAVKMIERSSQNCVTAAHQSQRRR